MSLKQTWSTKPNTINIKTLWILWGGVIILLLALLALGLTALYLFFNSPKTLPGAQTLGVDIGDLSIPDVETVLQQNWDRRRITLQADGVTLALGPEELGIQLDVSATAQRASQTSLEERSWADLFGQDRQLEIVPIWHLDSEQARTNLEAVTAEFTTPAKDATIAVIDGQARAIPGQPGQTLDVLATVDLITQNAPQIINEGRMTGVLKPAPPTRTASDLTPAVEDANFLLANPVSFRAYDPINDQVLLWNVDPSTWQTWLSFDLNPDDPAHILWTFNPDLAEAFLTNQIMAHDPTLYIDSAAALPAIEAAVGQVGAEIHLRIYHHQRQHTVQAGETLSSIARDYGMPYPWIQAANPGIGDQIYAGDVLTIPSPDELLPLPVVEHKRIIVSLSQQRMWAYENGQIIWNWPVSTGIPSSPTSPGVFQVQTHELNAYASSWNLWMPHFLGIYRPVPNSDFMNGFHGFPTRDERTLLWTGDLGHEVTYGCILVSSDNAIKLFDWAEDGVIVEVVL